MTKDIEVAKKKIMRKCDLINETILVHADFRKKPLKQLSCGLGLRHREKALTLPDFGKWFPLIPDRLSWHVCKQCGRVTTILDKITSAKYTKLGYIQSPHPEMVVLALIQSVDRQIP